MFSENKKNIQPKTSSTEQISEKNNTNANQKKIEEKITIYDEYLECLKNNPQEVCKDFKLSFDKTDI